MPSAALSQFLAAHLGAIVAPLDARGWEDPESIIDLEEHFADEMFKGPETMKPTYQAAMQVCDALTGAVEARAMANGGLKDSEVVQGGSNLGASHGWTESKAWWGNMERERQQLKREKQEQKRLDQEAKKTDAFFKAAQASDWLRKAVQLRAGIEGLYEQEREIERQCITATKTADSQKRAIAKYPQLAVASTPLNQEFVRRYNGLKASGDAMLQDPDWPEKLAKQCSDSISASSQVPAPADKKDNAQQAPNATVPAGLADKLANTRWSYPNNLNAAPGLAWFTLNSDMTVRAGWHAKSRWWKVLDDSSIVMTVTHTETHPRTLTFNKDLTEATDGKGLKYHRINTPAAK
jgi:hypothetical protein